MSWEGMLPDGTTMVFPDGATDSEVRSIAYRSRPDLFPDAPSGFFAAAEAGTKRLLMNLSAVPDLLYGKAFDDEQRFKRGLRSLEEADEWASEAHPAPVSVDDVGKAFEEEGIISGLGKGFLLGREVMGGSIPYMLPAGVLGKGAAGPGAKLAARQIPSLRVGSSMAPKPIVRAAMGHAAGVGSMIPAFFADNLARQVEAGRASPETLQIAHAALAAPLQAGMEYVFVALLGNIGRAPQQAAAFSVSKFLNS